jgi:hypothetical protein
VDLPPNAEGLVSLSGLDEPHYRAAYSRTAIEADWQGGTAQEIEDVAWTLADLVRSGE